MKTGQLRDWILESLSGPQCPGAVLDLNVALLEQCLERGSHVASAVPLPLGLPGVPGALLLVRLRRPDGFEESLHVAPGPGLLELVGQWDTAPSPASETPEDLDSSGLRHRLGDLFAETEGLQPEERAAILLDWIMEAIDASRCALVPVEGGLPAEPLARRIRGRSGETFTSLPRRIVQEVIRTRQPVVSDDVAADERHRSPSASIVTQGIRSFLAVPIVFRGSLLAVAMVDRRDRAAPFTREQRATFHALAYDLARPLLVLRAQREQRELDSVRDAILESRALATPSSAAMEALLERVRLVAPLHDENILLLGETGSGKEWVARRIHEASGRKGPFVAVNVAAIPSELFESEIFGVARGAFTGAVERAGQVVEATGGTLFLDEIGDLDLPEQVKLLRLLQERTVRTVGGRSERHVDVRLVAATSRPLVRLVGEGSFREDLLHRFAPPLTVPPLRQRREEILPLAELWLTARARARGERAPVLDEGARELLLDHAWPGNVRQLHAVLSHAMLEARSGVVTRHVLTSLLGDDEANPAAESSDAPPAAAESAPAGVVTWAEHRRRQDATEADMLRLALERCGGNVEATSRLLQCPQSTLRRALARHGIDPRRR